MGPVPCNAQQLPATVSTGPVSVSEVETKKLGTYACNHCNGR